VEGTLEEFLEKGEKKDNHGPHGTHEAVGQAHIDGPASNTSHSSHHSSSPPSHIFLGGGASLPVLASCASLLAPGGRMVVAAVLLSTLETARSAIQDLGWPLSVHQLMHHVSSPLAGDLRLVPSNPVFLLATQKPHVTHE
jgi:precorrin-6B methylase 2